MTHGKKQTRQEAAEQFLQLIVKMCEATRLEDKTERTLQINQTEKEMRQALGRVLCFDLPDPQPSKIPNARTSAAIEEANQITEPRFKTSTELFKKLEKEAFENLE